MEQRAALQTGNAVGPGAPTSAVWARLEDQIAWYGSKSSQNQRWFKGLKVLQIVTAAAPPARTRPHGYSAVQAR